MMLNLTKSMFGIDYFALSGLRSSWLCHFIELRSMLGYYTLSGQILVTSPERETSLSEAVTPLANNRLITLANDMMKTFRILHDNNTSLR